MLVDPVWPSELVAVTVYTKVPVVAVPSAPGELEPFVSVQVEMPGPVGSAQVKWVATTWPKA
jgi:hypothetical protein